MNRKKKINQTLKARLKRSNAKLHNSNKPKYISKAEREKLEEEEKAKDNDGDSGVAEDSVLDESSK